MHMTLAEFMELEKLTDAGLAEKVGRDRSNVTRWRRGDTKPDFEALVAIEKITGGKVTALDFARAS
jgi:transcriptional regulator with XRE-family HTH domain